MDLSMPVTLVIKAPNQKIADLTVECGLEWTIRKLKQHLSSVYPNKPKETQQRIIYSGKLLQDQMMLKDVLRQYDPNETTNIHTVHLVCSPSYGSEPFNYEETTNSTTTSSSSHTPSSTSSTVLPSSSHQQPASSSNDNSTDGLRHRQTHTTQDGIPPPVSHNQFQPPQPPHGMNMNNVMDMGYMFPACMMPYSPEHMVWMQQMYAQQMAQYMQYYQQMYTGGLNTPPTTIAFAPAMPENVENLAGAPAGPAAAPANPRPAGQQPIRMNAQGGPVLDDDDEDGGNRDWLDWVYTMCRIAVLFSIVYFYSTLGRFMFVFTFFFLIYVYQAGWFRVRRREARPAEQPEERQDAPPVPHEGPAQPPQPPQDQNEEAANNVNNAESEQPAEEAEQRPEVLEPEQPGALQITWSFVSTFFTSLVPHQPPAVNAN